MSSSAGTWGRAIFLSLLLLAGFFQSSAQRCGTVIVEQHHALQNPNQETEEQFEKWMKGQLARHTKAQTSGDRTESFSYVIPVVVHILYNPGDNVVGVRSNLSVAQIQSQIDAINRDYPRLNADSVNTPAEFEPVAGKINVQFVLAKQDPQGAPTNGITRDASPQTSWTTDDETTFKAVNYWPAENYLNIWVINLNDGGIIGFSQLPQSNLGGLSNTQQNRLTDGVTIDYEVFGDNSNGGNFNLIKEFNKGRTVTHEIGHIFGLRHIWGDVSACTGTDYCDDTPNQDGSTSGCPLQPATSCSPAHDKMFQNYMDYTDDACYNLFTKDQIARMVVILGNSPRRASLLVSQGAVDPTQVANDLQALKLASPDVSACAGLPVVPGVQVRNLGNNTVTSAQIQFSINGVAQETKSFSVNLNYLDTVNLTFSPVALATATSYTFTFSILTTNGGTDGRPGNNALDAVVNTPYQIALPFVEPFNSLPSTWTIVNPDFEASGTKTWTNVTATYTSTSNTAMYLNFYNYESRGQQDRLVSPVFDLSTAAKAVLKFDRSYALFSTANADQLMVVVSTSCDTHNTTTVFNKSGVDLATAGTTQASFAPKSADDWKTETIDLSQFLGQANVQISFIGVNQNGNNLYLDNVSVTAGAFTDLSLVSLKNPSPVSCIADPIPVVNIANLGSTTITTLTISSVLNNSSTTLNETFSGFSLATGQDMDFSLRDWTLNSGTNAVTLALSSTDTDISPANNTLSLNVVYNAATTVVPLRENFDGSYPDWSLVSPTRQITWTPLSTNDSEKAISLEYKAYSNTTLGSQGWLVSPVLKLGSLTKASVFFDLSYYESTKGVDELQLLASTDCGATYPTILFGQSSDSLALYSGVEKKTNSSWVPNQDTDWKRIFVSLDKIVGSDQARLAWVVTNGNGNNIFVDNIEFFVDDNTAPQVVDPLFSLYSNYTRTPRITFNLPESENVRLVVYDLFGRVIIDSDFENVLNQTYSLDMSSVSTGVYVVRVQMGSNLGTAKVVIGN